MRLLALALAAVLALPGPAAASERPDFTDRPGVGQPLRYTDAAGHVFRPRSLIVVTGAGAFAAALPASTDNAYSEEHLDVSDAPLVGRYFRSRLAPHDAAREGAPIGPVRRVGDTLVLDARGMTLAPGSLDLVLTANFPRDGAVSYRLGRLSFAPAAAPTGAGRDAGTGYLVGRAIVLAGLGREPLITDWGRLFGK